MARMISTFLTVVLLSLVSNVTNADSFGVTLRYWDVEESAPGTKRITPNIAYFQEDTETYMPGLNLRWSPDSWEGHDFLLSYFVKERNRELVVLSVPLGEVNSRFNTTERSDYELLVRTRANESVFFYYGLRYIERINTIPAVVGPEGEILQEQSKNKGSWNLAEVGLGLASSFSENGRHSLFANAVGGLGRSDNGPGAPSQNVHAFDLNAGYQYTVSPRTAVSLRYRSLSLYLDNELSLITSGIDLGLTINF